MFRASLLFAVSFSISVSLSGLALAHGDARPDKNDPLGHRHASVDTAFGRTGDAGAVNRTIAVSFDDSMRFTPSSLSFQQGDVVRLMLHNGGSMAHEFILGTETEIREHAALMKRFPTMVHSDPSSKRLQPGESAEIIWHFTKAGRFEFACLIPGHAEAGMHGTIDVAPAKTTTKPAIAAGKPLAAIAKEKSGGSKSEKTAPQEPARDELTHGEVQKVDAANGKITIRHGEIRNLGMPGMTMTFTVDDKSLLNGVAVGDRIDFRVEEEHDDLVIKKLVRVH